MKTQQDLYKDFHESSKEMWEQCEAHGKGQDPALVLDSYLSCMRGYGYKFTTYTWHGDFVEVVSTPDNKPIYGSFKAWNMKGEEDLQSSIKKQFGNEWYAYIDHVANSDVSFQFRRTDETYV